MSDLGDTPEIEAIARELCGAEGWNPDELVECEPWEAIRPQFDGQGGYACARWEPYAPAARKIIASRLDEWETF